MFSVIVESFGQGFTAFLFLPVFLCSASLYLMNMSDVMRGTRLRRNQNALELVLWFNFEKIGHVPGAIPNLADQLITDNGSEGQSKKFETHS